MLSARCAARSSSSQRGKAKGIGQPLGRASKRMGSQRHRRDILLKAEKIYSKTRKAANRKGS